MKNQEDPANWWWRITSAFRTDPLIQIMSQSRYLKNRWNWLFREPVFRTPASDVLWRSFRKFDNLQEML